MVSIFYAWCRYATHVFAGTAIETPTKVTVRLTVVKDKPYVQTPHFRVSTTADESGEFYGTTGVAAGKCLNKPSRGWLTYTVALATDIREATRDAVRNMIIYLHAELNKVTSQHRQPSFTFCCSSTHLGIQIGYTCNHSGAANSERWHEPVTLSGKR